MEVMSIELGRSDALPRTDMSYYYRGIDPRMAQVKENRTSRCLLALDGGGVRAFSQIEILHEISSRIKHDQGLEDWPCLCDYFDLIGGVGTGGYIAILIGRMGLITPILKEEFTALLVQVLAGPMEVTELDDWLKELVRRYTGNTETLMFDRNSPTNHCKTFIGATTSGNIAYQTKFRSYEAREGPNFNPPIWQVLRATLAHPKLFPGVNIGPNLIHQVYISGEIGCNNPSHEVIKEFELQWKHQNIGCLANIGTGHKGAIQIKEINGLTVPAAIGVALERLATDCERIADEITHRFRGHNAYYRLSVEHGLDQNTGGMTLEEVVTHTNSYLCSAGTSISVDALVESLLYPFEVVAWSITREYFEEALDSYAMKAKERVNKLQIANIKRAAEDIAGRLETIRNMTSNEEQWLKLVKAIDRHFDLIDHNAGLQIREPLSATPFWGSIDAYLMELKNVERSVDSLLKLNSHKIWGSPIIEPFLSKCLTNLEEPFKKIESALINDIHSQLHQNNHDRRLEKLLAWVSPLEPERRHDDVRAKRSKGTGTWFLNTSKFQIWCNDGSPQECRALCSFGKPTAGKTIICSSVIEYLREKHRGQPEVAVAFLYCDYRDRENQTVPNMIGSLAKQLIWQAQSIPQTMWEIFELNTKERKAADSEVAEKLFTTMLHNFHAVYICIDALDECGPQHRDQLLQLFKTWSQTSLQVFITGRQSVEAEVTAVLASLTPQNVPIVANEEDIRIYISQKIAKDPYPEAMDEKLKMELVEKIVGLSQGIFLLPMLQIQSVLEHDTKRDRRLALSDIPTQLFETYNATFERIKQQSRTRSQRALAVLTWVYLAQRQLHVLELQHALAVKADDIAFDTDGMPSEKALVDCCLGLVVVEAETSTVRLTHFTLQEHLNRYWAELFPLGHTKITTICLTYLNFDHRLASHEEMARASPLMDYVARNVGHHLRMGSDPIMDQPAISMLKRKEKFQLLEAFFEELLCRYRHFGEALITFPLHWAAYFGAISIVKILLESAGICGVNTQDMPHGGTPLTYAAEEGHTLVVQLLSATQGVDIDSRDRYGQTPLSFAAKRGHKGVVQFLIGTPGINVDSRDEYGQTPLSYAAEGGHEGVVRLLVGTPGVSVNSGDENGQTPLLYAAKYGHEGVARLLVNTTGTNIDSRDKHGRTPLWYAVRGGHEGIVRLLVGTPGINIDPKDTHGRTPFWYAVSNGQEGVVRLLVGIPGVDTDLRDEHKRSPLWYAIRNGHEGVVQLLLGTPGVNIDPSDLYGQTPLLYAAKFGHERMVQLLLATSRVNINSRDVFGHTPLWYAAGNGHKGVIQLLAGASGKLETGS